MKVARDCEYLVRTQINGLKCHTTKSRLKMRTRPMLSCALFVLSHFPINLSSFLSLHLRSLMIAACFLFFFFFNLRCHCNTIYHYQCTKRNFLSHFYFTSSSFTMARIYRLFIIIIVTVKINFNAERTHLYIMRLYLHFIRFALFEQKNLRHFLFRYFSNSL